MVFKLLAVRDDAFVIPTTSRVHIYQVLNSLANRTPSLCRHRTSFRMTQYFLHKKWGIWWGMGMVERRECKGVRRVESWCEEWRSEVETMMRYEGGCLYRQIICDSKRRYLHFLAMSRFAVTAQHTGRGVHKQCEVQVDGLLPLSSLLVSESRRSHNSRDSHCAERVYVHPCSMYVVAWGAVILFTWLAAVFMTDQNVLMTHITIRNEFGCVRIVHMVQNHHTRVLCPSQLVELIVVALTEIQEGLSRVKVLAF